MTIVNIRLTCSHSLMYLATGVILYYILYIIKIFPSLSIFKFNKESIPCDIPLISLHSKLKHKEDMPDSVTILIFEWYGAK